MIFRKGGRLSSNRTFALFVIDKYLYKFGDVIPQFRCELFDRLVAPVLNYGTEVWGLCHANAVERLHLKFCKELL